MTYFIFGSEAASAYYETDFTNTEEVKHLASLIAYDGDLVKFKPNVPLEDVLCAYDGWGGYAPISAEEYKALKRKVDLIKTEGK